MEVRSALGPYTNSLASRTNCPASSSFLLRYAISGGPFSSVGWAKRSVPTVAASAWARREERAFAHPTGDSSRSKSALVSERSKAGRVARPVFLKRENIAARNVRLCFINEGLCPREIVIFDLAFGKALVQQGPRR